MTGSLRFRLLGDIGVDASGRWISLGRPRERLLCTALLLAKGALVPTEQLVHRLWDEETAPETAFEQVRDHAKRLRGLLRREGAGDVIPRATGGYRIDVPSSTVDVHRFHELVGRARSAPDPLTAVRHYRSALAEWGEDPFGATGEEALPALPGRWAEGVRRTLGEEFRAARLACLEAELKTGPSESVIADLHQAHAQGSPDQKVAELLILALHRAGRTADALRVFEGTRRRLADELGISPGRGLEETYLRVLRDDPSLHRLEPPEGTMNTNEDESSSLAREAVGLIAETSRPVTEGRVLAPFAHRLLQRVSDQFAGLAGEEGALTWVRKNPDDPAALIALHDRLARHLRDDPRFAADLADLVRGHKSSGGVSVSAEKIEKVAIVQGNGHIENFTM